MQTLMIEIDIPPQEHRGQPVTLPFMFAQSNQDHAEDYSVKVYHCPNHCTTEELRLTWDSLRRRHAGFCKACKKLWPLPRRALTAAEVEHVQKGVLL